MEIWIAINGNYSVSNFGRIRSDRFSRILKTWITKNGYERVDLGADYRNLYVHRLVAFAFCTKTRRRIEVNHIDRKRSNNVATNLEWVTPKKNCYHRDIIIKFDSVSKIVTYI